MSHSSWSCELCRCRTGIFLSLEVNVLLLGRVVQYAVMSCHALPPISSLRKLIKQKLLNELLCYFLPDNQYKNLPILSWKVNRNSPTIYTQDRFLIFSDWDHRTDSFSECSCIAYVLYMIKIYKWKYKHIHQQLCIFANSF